MEEGLNTAWKVGRLLLGGLSRVAFHVEIVDEHNLPRTGGAVIAPNHISSLDPLLIGLLPARRGRMLHFFSGTEFFARPLIGHALRALKQIPLERGKNDTVAMGKAIEIARSGGLVALFPEGRINNGPELLRGRRGAARIAVGSVTPLIPVGIWGTQVRWPGGRFTMRRPWRPKVVVVIGEAMAVDPGAASARDILHVTNELMSRIETLRDRARELAGRKGHTW